MTLSTCLLLFLCGAGLAFVGWAIVRGGTMKPTPAVPEPVLPKAKRKYYRGPCAACGEIVPLRQDGEAHARFHRCQPIDGASWPKPTVTRVTPEEAAKWQRQNSSEAIDPVGATVMLPDGTKLTIGPQETASTWPPAKAEEGKAQS